MTTPVPPLPRRRTQGVGVEIAAHLERLIAIGELASGTRLPAERELAGSLRVSRGSLREALRQLEAKSLVERVQGRGTVVVPAPPRVTELSRGFTDVAKELADVAELRSVVEPRIAEFAALRATPSDLLQLEEILHASHDGLMAAESLRLDIEFHSALARASQNPLLATVNTVACSWTGDVRRRSHTTRRARRISVEGHRAIFAAVLARDGAAAATAMGEHLADVAALTRAATESDG
ncbi:MAG TPA: FCD domain-containing protein [Pseudonocardia sp.]|jgi:GntR family transcriptional repressor for pyruvate dehydrogenase complex